MGRAFDLENLVKERKRTVLAVEAESRPGGATGFLKLGNVILSYIRIQLTVILILPTFISKDQLFTVSTRCKGWPWGEDTDSPVQSRMSSRPVGLDSKGCCGCRSSEKCWLTGREICWWIIEQMVSSVDIWKNQECGRGLGSVCLIHFY